MSIKTIRAAKLQIAKLQEENRQLKAEYDKLVAENAILKTRLEELERRFNLNSGNSSKPPSSDGLNKKARSSSLRTKGQKPSGGQKGHKGGTLEQVANPDSVIVHAVHLCEKCQQSLINAPAQSVIKRQVFDIPVPKTIVTEHQAEVKVCSGCGHVSAACFPVDVNAPVQYGTRIKALSVYMYAQQFIPEDRLQAFFQDVFEVPISTVTLNRINKDFANIVEPVQAEILIQLKSASVKHQDETGFRMNGKTGWLHVVSNDQLTHYRVSAKRKDLLEDVTGIVVHDHLKSYFTMRSVTHALCNAHHLRELKALIEIEKEGWALKMYNLLQHLSQFKNPLLPPLRLCFSLYYDYLVAQGLKYHQSLPPLKSKRNKRRPGHNLLLRLKNFKEAVLRFFTTEGVPFTNNQAERDIRMMKVKQKVSGGFRTVKGAETFCAIKGFLSTKRKQNLPLFSSIYAALCRT